MTTQPILYRHAKWVAKPHLRTSPEDAKVIARLAMKAVLLAADDGIDLSYREAVKRSRENLIWARAEIERATG